MLAEQRTGVPTVVLITGMAGCGKTALAIHVAHRVVGHYPDGMLFVRLSTLEGPLVPGDILENLIRQLGVPGEHVPPDTAERAAMYRSLMHHRRLLVTLDDAADLAQLSALIPPPSSAALITSRRQFPGLAEAQRIVLDVLPSVEAVHFAAPNRRRSANK